MRGDRRVGLLHKMMRIVIVNCVYPPEPVVSAKIGQDLYEWLNCQGHEVTVLCPFPTRPFGVKYRVVQATEPYRNATGSCSQIVRLTSFTAPNSRLLGRIRESISFGMRVCGWLRRNIGKADVIYINSWPLFSQGLIALHCLQHDTPLVVHIQDVYPESMNGRLPAFLQRLVFRPLRALDQWIAESASSVVVISPSISDVYTGDRMIECEKVKIIPNWIDTRTFDKVPSRSKACLHYRVSETLFTFMFLGNLGKVAGLEYVIRAFHRACLPNAQLIIAGDGAAKADCVELARSIGVEGVTFISDPDSARTPLLLALAHVCLLPMLRGSGATSIPSKLLAYMLSKSPVVAAVDSDCDTARCIREAQCGWICEPQDEEELSNQMRRVAKAPATELKVIGERGSVYARSHFSKRDGVARLAQVIIDAACRGA